MTIEVIKPGAQSLFQDLGRRGYQHLGVPVGGAMDEVSHRLANLAVGNGAHQGTLEVTLLAPTLKFHTAASVAWAGADFSPTLDGRPLEPLTAHAVAAGSVLAFGARSRGLRAYLAVAGGYALHEHLGSVSTYPRVGLGGHAGRALRKGDRIGLVAPAAPARSRRVAHWLKGLPPEQRLLLDAVMTGTQPIRLLPGREWEQFTEQAQRDLLCTPWRLSPRSDRMGYRLEGPALMRHPGMAELLSETVTFGTMQVPPDGQPITLMSERQTVGGYPRIAQVASVDLPRLAQLAPGDEFRFAAVDINQAQALWLSRQRLFSAAEEL